MGDRLRIGLVGCGAVGRAHLDEWREIGAAVVTAVCDLNLDHARSIAGPIGAEAFASIEALAASGRVDAIDICTPSGLHGEQGLIGARYGRHVLVEKPLELRYDRACELVELCEARGLTLGAIMQRRAYAAPRFVAEAVHAGRFGRLLSCSAGVKWWRPQSYYDSARWRGSWELDGGVLANQAIHTIDHMVWTAGRVRSVEYAFIETASHNMEAEDHAIAVLAFSSGARGVIQATTACNPPLCSRMEVFGAEGAAAFDDARLVSYGWGGVDRISEAPAEADPHIGGRSVPMAINMAGHRALMADFVDAALTGRTPMVSGRDALPSVEALEMIYRSASPCRRAGR